MVKKNIRDVYTQKSLGGMHVPVFLSYVKNRDNQEEVKLLYEQFNNWIDEYSGRFSISCPAIWKSLLNCLFVHNESYFYQNIYKGCYAPLMRQGLDKYSHRNEQIVKHK